MAEHEQGAERWGEWQKGGNGAVVRESLVAEEVQWMTPELANAIEADLAALRQQLADAEAKAALADEAGRIVKELRKMATRHQQDELVRQLRNGWWYRYDALSEPVR